MRLFSYLTALVCVLVSAVAVLPGERPEQSPRPPQAPALVFAPAPAKPAADPFVPTNAAPPKQAPAKPACHCTGPDDCTCGDSCTCPACQAKAKAKAANLSWSRHDADQLDLLDDAGKQVGAYRISSGRYLPRVGPGWGERCRPPVKVPADPTSLPIPVARCRPSQPVRYFRPQFQPTAYFGSGLGRDPGGVCAGGS